eukprot:GHVS01095395.1.p1 GENE.GHVS01095395.1~~GHVS01095395.1.p1  ORF type:complete len:395 (+),score=57.39 GHVS01095395.1:3-1187(+)
MRCSSTTFLTSLWLASPSAPPLVTSGGPPVVCTVGGVCTAVANNASESECVLENERKPNAYLRPETTQGIVGSYPVLSKLRDVKLPFGVAQIGRSYRNEDNCKHSILRSREFTQMEIGYFISPLDTKCWKEYLIHWLRISIDFLIGIGIDSNRLKVVIPSTRSHYSTFTVDVLYSFPWGWEEVVGVSYRADHDLQSLQLASGSCVTSVDASSGRRFIPHIIEPSWGLDRLLLALLLSSYCEDKSTEPPRTFLNFSPTTAPCVLAVLPVVQSNKQIKDFASDMFGRLLEEQRFGSNSIAVEMRTADSIGRRYREADLDGILFCATVDERSLSDKTVTVRYRNTMHQWRMTTPQILLMLQQQQRLTQQQQVVVDGKTTVDGMKSVISNLTADKLQI